MHSLQSGHNLFVSLSDSKVVCLPDNYPVDDERLYDVKYNLCPVYNKSLIEKLDTE